MIKGLITNATILVSYFVLIDYFFKESEVTPDSPYAIRILFGVIGGVVGITLIVFNVLTTPAFTLDFKQIAIIVSACSGGWLTAIITGIIISIFCLVHTGLNYASIANVVAVQIIAIGCSLLSLLCLKHKQKWFLMTAYCVIASSIIMNLLIKDLVQLKYFITCQAVGLSILSFLSYRHCKYLTVSNRLMKKLKEESSKDFLTGLYNVRSFHRFYNNIMQIVMHKNKQLSILIIDIDFFKKVNDVYGHQSGNIVLKELSDILTSTCGQFDIVSRNGGEEFSVILIDCSSAKAFYIGERIRSTVEGHKFQLPDGRFINITVSIGLATFPDMASNKEELLDAADKALYKSKYTGRNKVCIFE
jgi:diguanylate cyclase